MNGKKANTKPINCIFFTILFLKNLLLIFKLAKLSMATTNKSIMNITIESKEKIG